jgi:hypothetical protein
MGSLSEGEQQWSVFNNQSKILVGGNGSFGKQSVFNGSISGIISL